VRALIVSDPSAWQWSSFLGYAHRRRRADWVAYDDLLSLWRGSFGGADPGRSYRRYVTSGASGPVVSPWADTFQGWILGNKAFVKRIAALVRANPSRDRRREQRRLGALDLTSLTDIVCRYFRVERCELIRRGSRHPARAAFCDLARQHTATTNAELVPLIGLSRPERVPNLSRRYASRLRPSAQTRKELRDLKEALEALW
jgi:hypothetical protein